MDKAQLLSLFFDDPRTREITEFLFPGKGKVTESQSDRVTESENLTQQLSDLATHQFTSSQVHQFTTPPVLHLKGLTGSSRSLVASAVFRSHPSVHVHILPDRETAAYFYNDLEQILDEQNVETEKKKVLFFPSSFKKNIDSGQKDNLGLLSRTEILNRLHARTKKFMIVTYPEALSEKVVNKKFLDKNTLKLKSGEAVSLEFVLDLLIEYEFERVDFVIEPGQFSLRGGLIDVYSFSGDHPYRIEFEGDNVASIRSFDPTTQLSIEKKAEITIIPDIRINREKRIKYDPVFTFLPDESVIWADDVRFTVDMLDKQNDDELFLSGKAFLEETGRFPRIEYGLQFYFPADKLFEYSVSPQPSFNKNFDLLFKTLEENRGNGIRNILLADNPKQAERLNSILDEIQTKISEIDPNTVGSRQSAVGSQQSAVGSQQSAVGSHVSPLTFHDLQTTINFSLHEGFIEKELKIACFTDHQIFERYHRYHLRDGYVAKEALTLKELYDLRPGDFVTHIDHGIGRFDGLEKIMNQDKEQEAIRLIYKNNDILYVSIHSLHRISKYVGKEGTAPVLNRLGSDAWNKLKNKTKSRVKDIARELIRLYAERRAAKGVACSPDTYLQTELEASFIYEDTPDQLKATVDVKKDLEAEFPMDRLVCGDVGFGKTEIAIRAAFKVVSESRQVAILVPTTILALQHFKTFSERLKDFPCTTEYINRFKSAKDQTRILKDLEEGKIDILIGTHRLLSKDIKFKDLGLLVIDEEQKFGVSSKEKIKHFKVNVDSLTLTATPIPRTLQFSLMGARDLSIINTPPPNRYPVQTEIHPFREEIIREAIQYELSRGGQVFFVTTRVQNITEIAGMVQRMVPKARVAIAHGQMEGHKLERMMVDFIEGDFDVLVATTIIESGLDISNVNTIIINDAHHYGLSDLHQLRGRVGRSNKKAFCYLLAPPMSLLTDEARKRLRAIEEFSELGSGFNIAMRDLDIRGAGNILGAEQSGFISEIGFDMYQKILDEAILELKEQDFKDVFKEELPKEFVRECQIETDLEILIPDDYITNITERLSLYKELDSLVSEYDLVKFRGKLEDRFGPVPEQTIALLDTIRLRQLARTIGFEKLVLRNNRLACYFISNEDSEYFQSPQFTAILEYIKANPPNCRMKEEKERLMLIFPEIRKVKHALEALEQLPVV
ncbi:MAG: transcription-repair coupling factor [Bacteroidetes bacterium]|nr:transcription-repair coupling factor [Bacteroidota bacterium]